MKEQHTKLSKQIPGYSHWSIDCTFTRNNVVERWDVVGDVDGNEAGTLTRVNVSTYPTILVLEEE